MDLHTHNAFFNNSSGDPLDPQLWNQGCGDLIIRDFWYPWGGWSWSLDNK